MLVTMFSSISVSRGHSGLKTRSFRVKLYNISILAYSPLAQGLLTGKFGPGHQFEQGDNRADNKLFKGENYERALLALEKLRPIAQKHQTTLANLALAWLIAEPHTSAIAGFRHAEQAADNAKACQLHLSPDDLAEIDTISRIVTDHLDDNPVMWEWS